LTSGRDAANKAVQEAAWERANDNATRKLEPARTVTEQRMQISSALRSGSLTVQELAQVLVKLQAWEWAGSPPGSAGQRSNRR